MQPILNSNKIQQYMYLVRNVFHCCKNFKKQKLKEQNKSRKYVDNALLKNTRKFTFVEKDRRNRPARKGLRKKT